MVFTTDRDIAAGEEMLISYANDHIALRKHYGFYCECGAARSLSPAQVDAALKHQERERRQQHQRRWH